MFMFLVQDQPGAHFNWTAACPIYQGFSYCEIKVFFFFKIQINSFFFKAKGSVGAFGWTSWIYVKGKFPICRWLFINYNCKFISLQERFLSHLNELSKMYWWKNDPLMTASSKYMWLLLPIQALAIKTEDRLADVVQLIFDKVFKKLKFYLWYGNILNKFCYVFVGSSKFTAFVHLHSVKLRFVGTWSSVHYRPEQKGQLHPTAI